MGFLYVLEVGVGERRSESCKRGDISVLNGSASRLSAQANLGVARANKLLPGEEQTRRLLGRASLGVCSSKLASGIAPLEGT